MDENVSSERLGLLLESICRSSGPQNELINPVGEPERLRLRRHD